jgi:hypothetical protein
MANQIYNAMTTLLSRIEPLPTEQDRRASHKRTIEQGLAAEFSSANLKIMGSHTRDTAIRHWSDIDYLAVLPRNEVTRASSRVQSTTILSRLKRALDSRFHQTHVRVSGPAVIVEFGGGNGAVDVVPAIYSGPVSSDDGYPAFEIPDAAGGWMRTSPQRHNKYILDADARSGHKLTKTIRLMKAWKYSRTPAVPLFGFHLEMLLASHGICTGPRSYQNIILDAFRLLASRGGAAFNDPVGISGRIDAVATPTQRATLVSAADYAAVHANAAVSAELSGKTDEAFRRWDIVFNGSFPARR